MRGASHRSLVKHKRRRRKVARVSRGVTAFYDALTAGGEALNRAMKEAADALQRFAEACAVTGDS